MRLAPRALPALTLVGALAFALTAHAQDDEKPDPKVEATKKLLQKAEEEYRAFFKRPETAYEFWAAMKFEIHLGKFDLAALHLKQLLAKEPPEDVNKDLVKIEAVEGLSTFLNLRRIRKWSDFPEFDKEARENVEKLIDRVNEAVKAHLSDPERIGKFVKRLDAPTPEERAFAFDQLYRSKEAAVPYLVDALRANIGRTLGARIREALLRLDPAAMVPLMEVLKAHDAKDAGEEVELRTILLDVLERRGEKRAVPYLWHLSASPKYPANVRSRALGALTKLTGTDKTLLPRAKAALTDLAEDYYNHRVRFPAGKPVRVWRWDGDKLSTKPVELTPRQAEEFFGLRHAREALDLDPRYEPAQIVFLSLATERAVEPELDQVLLKPLPGNLKNLLVSIDGELVARVLERALDEGRTPVVLGAVIALGERGDYRAAGLGSAGKPRGVLRALSYPDRRVQFAAARALVQIPGVEPPVAADRVVAINRRFLAADGVPKALAAFVPVDRANDLRKTLKDAGFDMVIANSTGEAVDKLRESVDYDLIVIGLGMKPQEAPFVLTQLRGDQDIGGLPVFLIADKARQDALAAIASKHKGVVVLPAETLARSDDFKTALEGATEGRLSAAERKDLKRAALGNLWRMARGEVRGYDVRPAMDAVVAAVRSPDLALEAVEILGRLPGREAQMRLLSMVTEPARGKLRVPAGIELNRHLQTFGSLIDRRTDRKYISDLIRTYNTAGDDQTLRGQVAIALGTIQPDTVPTGVQLFEYRPDLPPAPPMEDKGKKDVKEKDAK